MQSTNIRGYQGGPGGASLPRHGGGELSHGAGGRGQKEKRATASDDPWVGPLVPRGEWAH
jgi:hypothetical protein